MDKPQDNHDGVTRFGPVHWLSALTYIISLVLACGGADQEHLSVGFIAFLWTVFYCLLRLFLSCEICFFNDGSLRVRRFLFPGVPFAVSERLYRDVENPRAHVMLGRTPLCILTFVAGRGFHWYAASPTFSAESFETIVNNFRREGLDRQRNAKRQEYGAIAGPRA